MQTAASDFYDHRYWILARLLEGRRKNPRWSLRALALHLDVPHSALSEILSGKRIPTRKLTLKLAERLRLTAEQTRIFERSVLLARVAPSLPSDAEINGVRDHGFRPLDVEAFHVIAEWYHFAILSALETQDPPRDAELLARRLGIRKKQAQDALERLARQGLVESTKTGWRATTRPLSVLTLGYEEAVRNFLHQILAKAGESLERDDAELRELSAITLAIDSRKLPQAREAMKRFRRELSDLLETGARDRVYAFSLQLVPLEDLSHG